MTLPGYVTSEVIYSIVQALHDVFAWPRDTFILSYIAKVTQSCPTLCDSMDYTVHGILQGKILEWVAFPFSRGSSQRQGSNPGLPHCRQILYHLPQGTPILYKHHLKSRCCALQWRLPLADKECLQFLPSFFPSAP